MKFLIECAEVARDVKVITGETNGKEWRFTIISVKETIKTNKFEKHNFFDISCGGLLSEWVESNITIGSTIKASGNVNMTKDKATGKYVPRFNASQIEKIGSVEVLDDIRVPSDDGNEFGLPFDL